MFIGRGFNEELTPAPGAGHGAGCSCCMRPVPLQQNLDELDFQRGLWGLIVGGGRADQVREWLATHDAKRWLDARDKSGYTPLLYAVRSGDVALCELLLDRGADCNAATPGLGLSCLHRAASMGHVEVVRLLLMRGATLAVADVNGKTPLDHAAEKEHGAIVALLQEAASQTAKA